MIRESLKRNHEGFQIDYETEMIMDFVSPFAFDKFKGKKSVDNYIQRQRCFISPKKIDIGFNPITQKEESIQYIPLFPTLQAILQHEDALSHLLAENSIPGSGSDKSILSFRDGTACKENQLFNSEPNALQICLYHDDFNIVNPLGNKTQKYKISAFYFVIGNFANKYKSRLKDIHLCILSPATFVNKYGYEKILRPLLDDLLKLETEGIKISFEGVDHKFCGSLSMVIADNLAAHVLGGFFCNFSTVQRFCRFCNCRKNQINKNLPIENFILRTKEGYENNLQSIELDPNYSSLYGIKSDSCLHSLNFFHVTVGLPPDLAHDLFEGFGVDLVTNVIVHLVKAQYFNLEELNDIIQTFSY